MKQGNTNAKKRSLPNSDAEEKVKVRKKDLERVNAKRVPIVSTASDNYTTPQKMKKNNVSPQLNVAFSVKPPLTPKQEASKQ